MSGFLTAEGYEQTKEKLRDLETRLAEIQKRTDLDPEHLARGATRAPARERLVSRRLLALLAADVEGKAC